MRLHPLEVADMIDGNDPCFPIQAGSPPSGVTIRAHIAAMAMQGILACPGEIRIETADGLLIVPGRKIVPTLAVEYADLLIAELNKDAK